MVGTESWVTLRTLIGAAMPVESILKMIAGYHRVEAVFTLSCLASDLANKEGGVTGADARAWTHDLLVQRVGSDDPTEAKVASAVQRLPRGTAIAHGHVVQVLQYLALAGGSPSGRRPPEGQLAFLMLALNDHIPQWPEESPGLSDQEDTLAAMMFFTIFNRTSDDPLRHLVRTVEIMGGDPAGGPVTAAEWSTIQSTAFGCSFVEYVERFLAPLLVLSCRWSGEHAPVLDPRAWQKADCGALYTRWFAEASIPVEDAACEFGAQSSPTAPLRVPGEFYRKPFLTTGDKLLALSPWHVRDHASLGTWDKLNRAAKTVLKTDSNQGFSSTFGLLFEKWCRSLATEAASAPGFSDELLLPSAPGAADEVEDVVFISDKTVVLMSAKSSLVREASLKSARRLSDAVAWLRQFFFEPRSGAKVRGYRGGAVLLLDRKITDIRAGRYQDRGIPPDAEIVPVVLCYDNVGESGILYKWIRDECAKLAILSSRPGVLPLTVVTPEDYEALLAIGASGKSICELLASRVRGSTRLQPLDWHLRRVAPGIPPRLPSMERRFREIMAACNERLRSSGVFDPPDTGTTER